MCKDDTIRTPAQFCLRNPSPGDQNTSIHQYSAAPESSALLLGPKYKVSLLYHSPSHPQSRLPGMECPKGNARSSFRS